MRQGVNWENPYRDRRGTWRRGNLHTHTAPASPCGSVPLPQVLDAYARAGYDFLAVSDHMTLSEPEHDGLVLIPGVEWHSPRGEHTGLYTTDTDLLRQAVEIHDQDRLLADAAGSSAVVVLNHPNWQLTPHYRREQLDQKTHFQGIEIYNAVIERLAGNPDSTDKWDYLLARGRKVLGFACDDSHTPEDIGRAWICVRAAEGGPEPVLTSIREGNFYCSTGVRITDVGRNGDGVSVTTEDAEEIHVVGEAGRVIARFRDRCARFDASGVQTAYVRLVAYGRGAAMAWTQPFFL